MTNALPTDNGMIIVWAPDLRHVREALLGLLAEEQAEEGGVATVEEDEEEQRGPSVGGAAGFSTVKND